MITSLELTNWKTHRNTKLTFQGGVNVLVGIMGAGKSSTTDAISYALFGNFPSLNSGRVGLEGIISTRPAPQSEAEVRLEFGAAGDRYTVVRKIGARGSSARLEKNGAYLQSQPKKVTEEIEHVLKIDYDTFSRAIYAEQNRLEYFLELREGERKKQIDRMLGLDTFALAEANSTSLINSLRADIKAQEDVLSKIDIGAIREQLKSLSSERDGLSKEQAALAAKAEALKSSYAETSQRLEAMRKELQKRKAMEQDIVKATARIATLKAEVAKISATVRQDESEIAAQCDAASKSLKVLSSELNVLKEAERSCNKQVAALEAEMKLNRGKASERDKLRKEMEGASMDKVKAELDGESEALQALLKDTAAKSGRLSELRSSLRELEKHASKCPICERDLTPELRERLVMDKTHAAQSAETEIKGAERQVSERSARIKKLVESHNNLVILAKRLADLSGIDAAIEIGGRHITDAAARLASATAKVKAAEKALDAARDESERLKINLQHAQRKRSYESEINSASQALESARSQLAGIPADDSEFEALQESKNSQNASLSDALSKIDGNSRYLSSLSKQIAGKEKEVADFSGIEKRIGRRRAQVTNLNKFKSALVETEAALRAHIVGAINVIMQGLWSRLYPYGDYVGLRLNATKDDYMLEFSLPSASAGSVPWVPVDRVGSGGERSVAALAMRIALAMVVVPNLKWLILDEPTHNIDSAGISKLIDVLGTTLPQIVEQIFIITHDDDLKQISSAKVYQFDRDKAAGAPTSVAQL